jgi:TonB family protein
MPPQTTRLSLTLLIAYLCLIAASQVNAQDTAQNERRPTDFTSEGWGRSWATKKVLPVYPAEAIAENVQGVVEVGVGINDDGQIIKVRVPPGLDARLRKAAVAAVKQWKFRAWDNKMPPGGYCIFRLTFNFVIEEGTGRVELYDPPWDNPYHRRIRSAYGRDRAEFLSWEDALKEN